MLLGAKKATGPAPLELTEDKAGPPVNIDEALDLHIALEMMCCPQAELSVARQ